MTQVTLERGSFVTEGLHLFGRHDVSPMQPGGLGGYSRESEAIAVA
jgi:hypothetical protein